MACWCTPTSLCQFSKSLALTKISQKSWVMWGQSIYEVAKDLGASPKGKGRKGQKNSKEKVEGIAEGL